MTHEPRALRAETYKSYFIIIGYKYGHKERIIKKYAVVCFTTATACIKCPFDVTFF